VPVLVTDPAALAGCRRMRMGYATLLALLEPARARGFWRLAIIGIPCQVYALRALEVELCFERLCVIGTPCSDNTATENLHVFLDLLSDRPETMTYLEFRADHHVERRFSDGRHKRVPFLQLPISKLPRDFFPLTCRTCVDYTNVLVDIMVGYMGGQGQQWLLVRNERRQELLDLLGDEVALSSRGSAGKRQGAVKGFLANVQRAAGGLPLKAMPVRQWRTGCPLGVPDARPARRRSTDSAPPFGQNRQGAGEGQRAHGIGHNVPARRLSGNIANRMVDGL
jgi:coenzyme F420 hydrogenase subunit beta